MTKFADQLFVDLMDEYRPLLQGLDRPGTATAARRTVSRPVWLTAGTVGAAGAVAAGLVLFGGSPAYAVTQNSDGTVTVSVANPSGVQGADLKLRALGLHVVVVPVGPGCPSMSSLPQAPPSNQSGRVTGTASRGGDNTVTVEVKGVPAGATALVAAQELPKNGMVLAVDMITGPVPKCVSMPAGPTTPPVRVGAPGSGGVSGSVSGPSLTRSGATAGSGQSGTVSAP
jgi:hypothetical protein